MRSRHFRWSQCPDTLKDLRRKVFVCEWRIPDSIEFDHKDTHAHHLLFTDQRHAVATARLTQEGEIGRIAILPPYRTHTTYQAINHALIKLAQKEQLQHLTTYCRLDDVERCMANGFKPAGQVYMEAGIPRQPLCCEVERFQLTDGNIFH